MRLLILLILLIFQIGLIDAKNYSFKSKNIKILYSAYSGQVEYQDLAEVLTNELPESILSEDVSYENKAFIDEYLSKIEKNSSLKIAGMSQITNFDDSTRKVTLRLEDEFIDIDDKYSVYIVNSHPFKSFVLSPDSVYELEKNQSNQDIRTDLKLKIIASTQEDNRNVLIVKLTSLKAYYPNQVNAKKSELVPMHEKQVDQLQFEQRDTKEFELINSADKEQIFTVLNNSFNKLMNKEYKAYFETLDPLISNYVDNKETAVELIEKSMEGITITQYNIDIPIRAFIDDQHIVCIIPYTLNIDMLEGDTTSEFVSSDFIMARKLRNSNNWKISSMNGYMQNSTQFWKMFPDFPNDLNLPSTYIVQDNQEED